MSQLSLNEQEAWKEWEEENRSFILFHQEGINPYPFVLGYKAAIRKIKQEWLSVFERTPELIDGKDYSANVWATDGKEVFIMCYCWIKNEGFFWGDCGMKVDGDGEFGYYEITSWMPLIIPTPPKNNI